MDGIAGEFSGQFSQTTPSPSPSLALGTVDLGNPLPFPFAPWTRICPAAWAASQKLSLVSIDVDVVRAGALAGADVGLA